jgi:hypothetical protein
MGLKPDTNVFERQTIFDKGTIQKVNQENGIVYYDIMLTNRMGVFSKVKALGSGFGAFKIEKIYPKGSPVLIGYIGIAREPFIIDIYPATKRQWNSSFKDSIVREGDIKISNSTGVCLHLKSNGNFTLGNPNSGTNTIEVNQGNVVVSNKISTITLNQNGIVQIEGTGIKTELSEQGWIGQHFWAKQDNTNDTHSRLELEDGVASIGGNKGLILTCGPSATGTGQDFFIFVSTEVICFIVI